MSQDFTLFKQRLEEAGMKKEQIENILEIAHNSIHPKKYGLVWEEQPEEHVDKVKDKILYFEEDKSRTILKDSKKQPHHLLIEGDNYDALKLLQLSHKEKVDVIYIDPPYNRGKNDFVYNDDFVNEDDEWRHSKWLSFMQKRLLLAEKLLKKTGLILISIDEHEIAHLKMLCDQIFGESNCLANLVWDLGSGTQAGHFTRAHEYILVYAKNKDLVDNFDGGEGIIEDRGVKKISKKNPASLFTFPVGTKFELNDGETITGEWGKAEKIKLVEGVIKVKDNKLLEPITLEAGWAMKSQMKSWFSGLETFDTKGQRVVEFYFNKNGVLRYRKDRTKINPPTILRRIASTKDGTNDLKEFSDAFLEEFEFPKPKKLIKFLISTIAAKDAVILDFFAGSGTTAHAILELNQEDNGSRQVILCTNNEVSEEKQKQFFKLGQDKSIKEYKRENPEKYAEGIKTKEFQALGICRSITHQRVKKVIEGYTTPENVKIKGIPASLHYLTINETLTKEELFKTENQLPEDKSVAILPYVQPFVQLKENIWDEVSGDDFESNNFRVFKKDDNLIFIATNHLINKNIIKIKEVYEDLDFKKGILYTFSIDANESPVYSTLKEVGMITKPIPRQFIDGMEVWK